MRIHDPCDSLGTMESGRLRSLAQALRQFLYGMTAYEMVRDLQREQALLERRLAGLALGSLVGLPVPANYYGLRLLPYLLPYVEHGRRNAWRERDLFDLCDDLG